MGVGPGLSRSHLISAVELGCLDTVSLCFLCSFAPFSVFLPFPVFHREIFEPGSPRSDDRQLRRPPASRVLLNGYTIRGSIVGTRLDLEESLAFAGDGKVRATIETLPLESINDVLSRLKIRTGKWARCTRPEGGNACEGGRRSVMSHCAHECVTLVTARKFRVTLYSANH
jgi:hypothetical protein